jgi:hypothetical protein
LKQITLVEGYFFTFLPLQENKSRFVANFLCIDVVELHCAKILTRKFTFTVHRALQKSWAPFSWPEKGGKIVGQHELRSAPPLREINPWWAASV